MILGTSPIASNLHTGTLINFFVFVGPADLRNRRGGTRNDPERWKLECTNDIRKDSVNRSRWIWGRAGQAHHWQLRLFPDNSSGNQKGPWGFTPLPLCCFMIFQPSGVIIFLCCAVWANLSLWLWNLVVRWIRDLPLTEFTGVRSGLTTSYEFNYPGKHHF